jgi:hypothetical protein
MARINFEDSLWSDPRFLKLCVRLGDEEKAVGRLVIAWRFAQRFWCPDKKPMPEDAWAAAGLGTELIDTGLAKRVEKGIYLSGIEEQFAWWFQRQEAGKKGGDATAKKAKQKVATAKRRVATGKREEAGPKQNEPSYSSSFSFSSSSSSSDSESYSVGGEPANAEPPLPVVLNPVGFFIGRYRQAYVSKYGPDAKLDLRGKVQGQIKTLLSDVPLERACALIEEYCRMNDSWFTNKGHDFGTFYENLSKVGLSLDTGRTFNRSTARANEAVDHAQDQLARIARGEL